MIKATQPARRKVLKIMVAMSLSIESTGASARDVRGCFSWRERIGGGKGLLSSIPLSFTFCFREKKNEKPWIRECTGKCLTIFLLTIFMHITMRSTILMILLLHAGFFFFWKRLIEWTTSWPHLLNSLLCSRRDNIAVLTRKTVRKSFQNLLMSLRRSLVMTYKKKTCF